MIESSEPATTPVCVRSPRNIAGAWGVAGTGARRAKQTARVRRGWSMNSPEEVPGGHLDGEWMKGKIGLGPGMHQNAPRSQRRRPKTGARSSDRKLGSARILRPDKVMLEPARLSQTAQDVQGVAVNDRPGREGSADPPSRQCVRAV